MPDTLLILHVKGTEAQTAQLPKHIVRAAISQGQLTESQLIWSPGENTWKPAKEYPDLLPVERLILHVKGTEAGTRQLPKHVIRAAISQGKLTHSQLIWNVAESAWKQVREWPELLPGQKLTPVSAPGCATAVPPPVPRAVDAIIPESPTSPIARVIAASGDAVQVRVAAEAQAQAVRGDESTPAPVRARKSFKVTESAGAHPMKWICIGLAFFVVLVVGGNYLLVDQPLVSELRQTPYGQVPVYAHLGAFIQPNVMVIHLRASSAIAPDNLTNFLAALARSTPQNPLTGRRFERIALTSGWTVQYSLSGDDWWLLGEMDKDGEAQRKEFLLAQIDYAGGQPLTSESTLNEDAQKARREAIWKIFVDNFAAKP